jgi:hypothetical protein
MTSCVPKALILGQKAGVVNINCQPRITRQILTKGPNANPNTYNDNERVATSVLTPNSVDTALKVGEKEDDAKEDPIAVRLNRTVRAIFFRRGQFIGFSGSLGPSQVTMLLGQSCSSSGVWFVVWYSSA